MDIFKQLYSINIVNYVGVEDFSDRLSFLYTSTLMTVCCTVTIFRAYVMYPISCYLPNTFGSFHEEKDLRGQLDFVNNYCWSEGTYAVHIRDFHLDGTSVSGGLEAYASQKISFYQWVPFVLALQGLCFYLPRVLWHAVSFGRAGTDVGHIVKVAQDAARADQKKHDRLLSHACRMVEQMLHRQGQKKLGGGGGNGVGFDGSIGGGSSLGGGGRQRLAAVKRFCCKCMSIVMPSRLVGSWLILTYLLIKLAYLGNAIGQLALMQHFLQLNSTRYSFLGVNLLAEVVSGKDWHNTMVFPRVGCCAVFFRSAARGNWQFSQCALPINMIYEKIYIFLWFWFIFVGLATAVSILAWAWRLRSASMSSKFVRKYLKLADNYQDFKKNGDVKRFVRNFVHKDGAFLLKMVALNCGDLICSEMIQAMWRRFRKSEGLAPSNEPEQLDQAVLKLSCKNLPVTSNGRPTSARVSFKPPMKRQKSLPASYGRHGSSGSGGGISAATAAAQLTPAVPVTEFSDGVDCGSEDAAAKVPLRSDVS